MAKLDLFESSYARVFFILQQMMKAGLITENERGNIKDLIIQNDQQVQNLIEIENIEQLQNRIQEIISTMRINLEGLSDFDDDDSTTKSLRKYLKQKLRLNLKQSNFNLILQKNGN